MYREICCCHPFIDLLLLLNSCVAVAQKKEDARRRNVVILARELWSVDIDVRAYVEIALQMVVATTRTVTSHAC